MKTLFTLWKRRGSRPALHSPPRPRRMRANHPKDPDMSSQTVIRLEDYAPFPYPVREVALTFRLDPTATRVHARIASSSRLRGPF